jgi:hypothetical protein
MAIPQTLASLDDLTALLQRPLTDDQGQRAMQLLMRASALLRVQAPWVDDRIADGSLDPVVVGSVVAGIAKRVILNPGGYVAITTGPYSRTLQTRNGGGNDGDLVVTSEDVNKLILQIRSAPGQIKLVPALAPRVGLDRNGHVVEYGLRGYPDGLTGVGVE